MPVLTHCSIPAPHRPAAQTNGVIERFFGTLKYEHLYRGVIADGDALAMEVLRFRHLYNTVRPHQTLNDWTPQQAYLTSRESQ
ncbi:integrase core domain-containing protein [Amycolatopsis acidiphila]|uniref:Transposase n=1 Tax=Amycolatopsis acidiphila TaxID=715473 RepID=A0A558AIE1_9PSEU|nr:integrase core domain-containing protein [Amycolatopsis acidiphila]TVT24027.1 transposase [Amycolatopsis acidiphila]UIJ57829.1 integrase core domain-containing protein [Amycolatopsis acidiphila]GHG87905.1 hypothetical protein GCM10017788_61970 [Amycolatopsis acidiphila]